jgi:pimeloyl-ACP methyl ester carboxylesterase
MFGPVLERLAENHTVIAPDLQGHGRTLPFDRPMSYEAMATDIAGLVRFLGYDKADFVGYSLGGGVALRTGLDHPEVVGRLVLVSTVYAFSGWQKYNFDGMRSIAADPQAAAEGMKGTPLHDAYTAVAPDPANWNRLIEKVGGLMGKDYDWSVEIPDIKAETMLAVGDWDAVRLDHTVKFFHLLGGATQDATWDRSGMNANRLAVLPDTTHYEIGSKPKLAEVVLRFLAHR